MLQPVRAEGSKPPFFIVHGLHGVMPLVQPLRRIIDRDRPIYALHARGIDGSRPPPERMEDLLGDYLTEIRAVQPRGPYVVGGICAGGLVAMELARSLRLQGEKVGTAVLVDPPLIPFYQVPGNRTLNPKEDPRLHQHLYKNVEQILREFVQRFGELPFEASVPAKFNHAVELGIAMVVIFGRYVPPPFEGPTEFIISADRAFGHFHPEGPWKKIVAKPGRFHVVPCGHNELFYDHLDQVLRLTEFALDSAFEA